MPSFKKIAILLGAVLASSVFLKSDARPLIADDNKNSIVDAQKWTSEDVSTMAKSYSMMTVVSLLTNAAIETGTPELQLDEIKVAIDNKTPSDMRAIILTATDTNGKRTNKINEKIAAFARAVDPVATCATVDTAGGHGMNTCAEECERTLLFEAQDSRKASCHVLCTLATAPCAKGFYRAMVVVKSHTKSATNWIATAFQGARKLLKTVWIATTFQGAWKLFKTVYAMSYACTKIIVLCLLGLANKLRGRPGSRKWRAHTFKADQQKAVDDRDRCKEKGLVIAKTLGRIDQKRALHVWHDVAALATYKAAQEAAAEKAAKAKVLALNAAIDQVAAEQATRDQGADGCVLS
ncbi:unnamed protein product [Laminaria digitata]